MFKNKLSLRSRLFIAMFLLLLISLVVTAVITFSQYKKEAEEFHAKQLSSKETSIKQHIDYVLRRTTYPITTRNVPLIFKENDHIHELSEIHKMPIILYDLQGDLLIRSNETIVKDTIKQGIPGLVISKMNESPDKRFMVTYEREGAQFKASYTYITDTKFKPLAILNLPYLQNNDIIKKDIKAFIKKLTWVYIFMLLLCLGLAFFISKYISKSLTQISEKIYETRIGRLNKKIETKNTSPEVQLLVDAYNNMIDQLEESAVKLAISERENAWREMAKQVAHEIKNPLTPMRLTVQSFQRRFDPDTPDIREKLKEHSQTLIDQIDTMSSIASAFSNFAKMPVRNDEILYVNDVVGSALEIFIEKGISFERCPQNIQINFDRTQLIRVVTNLIKNALQAIPSDRTPRIHVQIQKLEQSINIRISDNGTGISEEDQNRIFEPNFTTKSSGMGLGLAMVKSIIDTYQGQINFETIANEGTTFIIHIPSSIKPL